MRSNMLIKWSVDFAIENHCPMVVGIFDCFGLLPQFKLQSQLYKAATNAVESQGSPFTLADANTGTQRRIGTNVSKLASRLSGGE